VLTIVWPSFLGHGFKLWLFQTIEFVHTSACLLLVHVCYISQVGNFQQENRRFILNITMVTPTILIPVKSDSTDLLLLKSGNLHIENEFDFTDIGSGLKQEWNHVYISLTYVQLSRYGFGQC